MQVPDSLRPLFWDAELGQLDLERDADGVLARVLEYGRLRDVHWAIDHYGLDRIHRFFRESAHPLISERTRAFWRAYFQTEEPWPSPPGWRKSSNAPWID